MTMSSAPLNVMTWRIMMAPQAWRQNKCHSYTTKVSRRSVIPIAINSCVCWSIRAQLQQSVHLKTVSTRPWWAPSTRKTGKKGSSIIERVEFWVSVYGSFSDGIGQNVKSNARIRWNRGHKITFVINSNFNFAHLVTIYFMISWIDSENNNIIEYSPASFSIDSK